MVDKNIGDVDPYDYDALFLTGGVINSDQLKGHQASLKFIKTFSTSSKPLAAIYHGLLVLIEAGIAKGKTMTSYDSIKTELENAGATWKNEAVVVGQGLITSRSPKDLPTLNKKFIEEIYQSRHL